MTIFNPELLKFAKEQVRRASGEKVGFTDPATMAMGDPMMAAGGGMAGAAPMMPGIEPLPPMPAAGAADPAAAGMDPAMAGGDPSMAAPPPSEDSVSRAEFEALNQKIDQLLQQQQQGGSGGGGGGQKMKIDVNTEIYHIKKLLTRIAGELGIQIDPQMLLGDPAQDPAIPDSEAAKDPHSAAASAIQPIEPIQPAAPELAQGKSAAVSFDVGSVERGEQVASSLVQQTNKAAALVAQLRALGGGHAA